MWYLQLKNGLHALKAELNSWQRAVLTSCVLHGTIIIFAALLYWVQPTIHRVAVRAHTAARIRCLGSGSGAQRGPSSRRMMQNRRRAVPKPAKKQRIVQKKAQKKVKKTLSKQSVQQKKKHTVAPAPQPVKKIEKKSVVEKEKPKKSEPVPEPEKIEELEPEIETEELEIDLSDMGEEVSLIAQAVGNAIRKVWAPPVASNNLHCSLEVRIAATGRVDGVVFAERSGSVGFDVMAQKAAVSAQYPRDVWGSTVIISF